MSLPDGVELHAEELRDELCIGAFLVKPRQTVYFFMDVGTEYFGQAQLIDDRVEALCLRVAAVWRALHNEEMDVVGSAKVMEILDLPADPFRLCRVGRTDDDEVLGSFKPFLQFLRETARLDVGRCEEYRLDGSARPSVLAA